MDRGDVYWLEMGPTKGHEQDGRRPVVVLTPERFNRLGNHPVVLPVTRGGQYARMIGFHVSLEDRGCRTVGIVRCDQPMTLDFNARKHEYIETLPEDVLDEILQKVRVLFM